MFTTESPFPMFFDKNGAALEDGYIYYGAANQNPQTAPVQVYWDFLGTQPAAQPVRTIAGYTARNGTPSAVFSPVDYSVTARNSRGEVVFYAANSADFSAANGLRAELISTGGSNIIGAIAAGSNAVYRKLQDILRETVSVMGYGASVDGVMANDAAFAAALTANPRVTLPPGTYRLTSPLVLTEFGSELIGEGALGDVQLLIDHTAGHGVVLANGYQRLQNILIYGSSSRLAAATNKALSGVVIGGSDAGANYLTSCVLDRLVVRFHPGIGVYIGGEGAGTVMRHVSSDYNKHHGFAGDDGTIGGSSPTRRCGIVSIESCRAAENGGNGINLSESGSTCYRIDIKQFETLSNAWNSAGIVGLRDAQAVIKAQNVTTSECGWDDQLFANTTTAGSTTRAAKGAASDGIQLINGTTEFVAPNNRFLTLTRCMFVRTGVAGFRVDDAYADPTKAIGFRIESGVTGSDIRLSSITNYTTPIFSDTALVRAVLVGIPRVLGTSTGANFSLDSSASVTIAADSLNAATSTVYVSGQGGVADNLQQIVMAGGSIPVPTGVTVRVVNRNAYNITVKHGLSNIFTKTAADVVLGQNVGISFASDGTNMYEV